MPWWVVQSWQRRWWATMYRPSITARQLVRDNGCRPRHPSRLVNLRARNKRLLVSLALGCTCQRMLRSAVLLLLALVACATAPPSTPPPTQDFAMTDPLSPHSDPPGQRSPSQLLRPTYASPLTGQQRGYLVHLPAGYESQPE